jgi:uncharacterized pyridoxal phosphate-containing UPF0001 family protein
MNEHACTNRYFSKVKEVRQHIRHFFSVTLADIADTLNRRINDQDHGKVKKYLQIEVTWVYIPIHT